MSECKFCNSLNDWKTVEQFDLNHPKFRSSSERTYCEYNAALVIRRWTKGNKAHAGRITDYRFKGIGFKLNFCPECGRQISKVKL